MEAWHDLGGCGAYPAIKVPKLVWWMQCALVSSKLDLVPGHGSILGSSMVALDTHHLVPIMERSGA